MATPHNSAEKGQIAKTVLMPGDPLRAKWIAETFLENPVLVSDVRNVYCYTGLYKGCQVSVMASGMGMPSIGIYSHELYAFYDVERIIRIGSAGAYASSLNVLDVVLASGAWSESSYGRTQNGQGSAWKYPSPALNEKILEAAAQLGQKVSLGSIHSSDVFYREEEAAKALQQTVRDLQLLCVEMESYALFHNAQALGKQAACLLTISDSFVTGEEISAEARATAFSDMVRLALEAAVR